MERNPLDENIAFRKLLTRTLILPLALLGLLSAVFVGQILYLKSLNRWVDHADRVIGQANFVQKLFLDCETGLRGFALTHDADFLDPYTGGSIRGSRSPQQARVSGFRQPGADSSPSGDTDEMGELERDEHPARR